LTRWSGGWINRIGRLTRGTALGGVEIDLPEGGADEGSGRLRGSKKPKLLLSCRKNRLRIIISYIAL
jgi:hypothetical protein